MFHFSIKNLVWTLISHLATQLFDIYFIVNQQTKTIADLWDGNQLRCTFRRAFSEDLMIQWQEVLAIAGSIVLSDQEDQMIWMYESTGVYSSKYLYDVFSIKKKITSSQDGTEPIPHFLTNFERLHKIVFAYRISRYIQHCSIHKISDTP
jgi:hypothetical protein